MKSSLILAIVLVNLAAAAPQHRGLLLSSKGRSGRQLTWEQLRSGNWGAIFAAENGGGLVQKILMPVDTVLALLPDEAQEILALAKDAVTNIPIIGSVPYLKDSAQKLVAKLDALLVEHGKLPLYLQAGPTTTSKPTFWESWGA